MNLDSVIQSKVNQKEKNKYWVSTHIYIWASQVTLVVKNPSANAGDVQDTHSISGSGRSPEEGHGNPLHYSCLENPMDRGAWWAMVHRVTECQT